MTVSAQPVAPPWFTALVSRLPDRLPSSFREMAAPAGDLLPRDAAVLILLGEGPDGPDVLLTERARTLRSHAGQVSFPGGRIDPGDDGPAAAAVREAVEETGLDPSGVVVAGSLPSLYLNASHHQVTPVIAWWASPSPVATVDPGEVAGVVRVSIAHLSDPANRLSVSAPSGWVGPAFRVADLTVWGFTAGLLSWLLVLGGWDRPWDASRVEPMPQ